MTRSYPAGPFVVVLTLSLAACLSKQGADMPSSGGTISSDSKAGGGSRSGSITVTGTLTDEGAECQAMRDGKTKELYTLTGNLSGFKPGDGVTVVGTVAEISFCQQGTTISVSSITRSGA